MKPTDVFVPGRYPIESNNAYAVRTQKQDDFSNGLRRFFVPIVYGGYGVGKSSMALKSVADNFTDHRIVYIVPERKVYKVLRCNEISCAESDEILTNILVFTIAKFLKIVNIR